MALLVYDRKQTRRRETTIVSIVKNGAVLRQLRTLFNVGTIRELTDGQLLERFATERSEAAELAFAVLVERHGPMVLRVCRSVLAEPHDALDAFQATFLVLVKKARSLWVQDSLGPWLHQAAYRTALRARSAATRRRRHERHAAALRAQAHAGGDDERARALHEEIERLPEYYRVPIVICELEGRSHEQAARHLGWPLGTVKSRLARGRDRLRDRLTRRGLEPSAGLLFLAGPTDSVELLVPSALAESTTRAVIHFVAAPAVAGNPVALLAHGVLKTMIVTRWLKAVLVALFLGAATAGACLLARQDKAGVETRREDETPVLQVKPGQIRVTVFERGVVEAARSEKGYCRIPGSPKILSILPEGTKVAKGQVVCELDSALLRDNLVKQQFATKQAQANFENAKLTREVAERAVQEYVSTEPDKSSKTLKELQSQTEKTRSDELAKRATHERQKRDEDAIRAQIERCTVRADIAGVVIHANNPNRAFRAPTIRQGKTVRERQIIFWISDHDGPMQVRVKLREEMVVKVRRGLRAQIRVDGLGEPRLPGTVTSVFPLPDPSDFFTKDDAKVYTTLIAIDKPPRAVRPGMTAQSEILITQLDGVLAVPIKAVLNFDGKDHVAVKKPDRRFEWREVASGVSDGTLVELKKGVKSGDVVALRPLSLWSKQRKP